MTNKKGQLIVMSAPSGAGKSTICRYILKEFDNISFSISYTTRGKRGQEKDGVDYFFTEKEDFRKKIDEGFWLEWAMVHGNYYGTSLKYVNDEIDQGKSILLDIDVAGAKQILEKYPDALTVFIMPPDLDELRKRLEGRGTDSAEVIDKRMKNAKDEIRQKDIYKYCIVNDDLDTAVDEFKSILNKESGDEES